MLKITKPSENRVDIELSGQVDADEMRQGLDDLITLSKSVEDGVMLYRINDFQMPTLAAIGVEMSRLPGLFGLLAKYDRCAVITEQSWLRKAAEFEGALFPGMEIRAFPPARLAEAELWLA